jgi:hypothetical protein
MVSFVATGRAEAAMAFSRGMAAAAGRCCAGKDDNLPRARAEDGRCALRQSRDTRRCLTACGKTKRQIAPAMPFPGWDSSASHARINHSDKADQTQTAASAALIAIRNRAVGAAVAQSPARSLGRPDQPHAGRATACSQCTHHRRRLPHAGCFLAGFLCPGERKQRYGLSRRKRLATLLCSCSLTPLARQSNPSSRRSAGLGAPLVD